MCYRVYLVEDDENLNQVLYSYLRQEGWDVQSFFGGNTAREQIQHPPHLWILDIMLKDYSGYTLFQEIKAQDPTTPVIFISARDAELDRLLGLEMGSEDYIAKPFLPKELVLRAKRTLGLFGTKKKEERQCTQTLGPYRIFPAGRRVEGEEKELALTAKELDLLLYFARNKGQALTREQILNGVWGMDYFGSDRVVDDLIRRLRQRMPEIRIETIYGYGYRVVDR